MDKVDFLGTDIGKKTLLPLCEFSNLALCPSDLILFVVRRHQTKHRFFQFPGTGMTEQWWSGEQKENILLSLDCDTFPLFILFSTGTSLRSVGDV